MLLDVALPQIGSPTSIAVGQSRVWVTFAAGAAAPAGEGRLVAFSRGGLRQEGEVAIGGDPVSAAAGNGVIWVANEAGSPSVGLAYQNTVEEVSTSAESVLHVFNIQGLNLIPQESPTAASGTRAWAITSLGRATGVSAFESGTSRQLVTLAGEPQGIINCGASLYVATSVGTTSASIHVTRLAATTGTFTKRWTIPATGRVALACTAGGVVLAVSNPTGGGLFDLQDSVSSVPRPVGPKTQFGIAVAGPFSWALTVRESTVGTYSCWLVGNGIGSSSGLSQAIRLRASARLAAVLSVALVASGHDLFGIMGGRLLEVGVG